MGWIRRHVSTGVDRERDGSIVVRHALDEHPDNLMIQVVDGAGYVREFWMEPGQDDPNVVKLTPSGTGPFRVVVLG